MIDSALMLLWVSGVVIYMEDKNKQSSDEEIIISTKMYRLNFILVQSTF